MEKKISMEEKKFKTLQDEFREINKQYQMNKGELVDQKEENSKLQGQIKLLREDVDHKIEEATGLFNILFVAPHVAQNLEALGYDSHTKPLLYGTRLR